MITLLHSIETPEEWQAACWAVDEFKRDVPSTQVLGKKNAIRYTMEAPEVTLEIGVWRDAAGRLHAAKLEDE